MTVYNGNSSISSWKKLSAAAMWWYPKSKLFFKFQWGFALWWPWVQLTIPIYVVVKSGNMYLTNRPGWKTDKSNSELPKWWIFITEDHVETIQHCPLNRAHWIVWQRYLNNFCNFPLFWTDFVPSSDGHLVQFIRPDLLVLLTKSIFMTGVLLWSQCSKQGQLWVISLMFFRKLQCSEET